ncbi:uroporphyrinogen decarboxylase [Hydrogenoanaerobacterium saccharovorans]|uniref:Uroporphyrinogen decarboxylase n=1 Tax=Hydrogenoanaerobacterium saccharovorans TaxID=474960 RepID=A0A1H8DLL1_9FIRM|nr:uroporphyrinogen decarboxylase family protein [Hydrogenoanaerobacterium saccharovorans]RPF42253.1 uroporphyrinogen decarboxylase [Hydrogenoanaerobacterium saccharovorans]SEN07664.1 uroporphyrinogen decarboxylase [Hydrogenoanaerobacterium saccharovorans]
MTHQQRILNTISRTNMDKFPVQFDFTPTALDRYAEYRHLSHSDSSMLEVMDNHIMFAYLNDGMGKLKTRAFKERYVYDEWQVRWDMAQEGTFFDTHPLEDIENYSTYVFPSSEDPELLDYANGIIKKYSDEYLVASYQALSMFERAYSLRGFENFLMDLACEPEFANELLDKITAYQVRVAQRYVQAGVNAGRIGDDYGSQRGLMMSPNMWREIIKPHIAQVISVYKQAGLPVIFHSCGDIHEIIPDFIEIGVDILHPLQPESINIEQVAEEFGDKIVFYGGISNQKVLPYGTPEDVKYSVKNLFDIFRRNGKGFILAPSNGIGSNVPPENIQAMLDAAEEYRYF